MPRYREKKASVGILRLQIDLRYACEGLELTKDRHSWRK